MIYRILADGVLILHVAFIGFVAVGALAVLRWRRLAYAHVPAFLWGALIEFAGWVCPLTPLEVYLRARGGTAGYAGGFVEHYLLPLVYPGVLTRGIQIAIGIGVLLLNALIYAQLGRRTWARRREEGAPRRRLARE